MFHLFDMFINVVRHMYLLSVALTHLEDHENARHAYEQAANLDK